MPQFYTTTPAQTAPAGADGVALTPNGSAWTWSAWTEIISSTSTAIALSAIVTDFASNADLLEFEVGVGPDSGSVTTIGRIAGFARNEFNGGQARYPFPVLLDNVPQGSKVWVRLQKTDTGTADWAIALEFYESPVDGNAPASAVAPAVYPEDSSVVTVTPNDTEWADGAWTEVHASLPTDWALAYFAFSWEGSGRNGVEVDFGIGSAGNETVIWTERMYDESTSFEHAPRRQDLWPLRTVPAGSRLAMRIRKEGSGTNQWKFKVGYYADLDLEDAVTEGTQKVLPAAQDGLTVSWGGSSLTEGSWVEFSSGLASSAALTRMVTGGQPLLTEWDVGTGGAGSEVERAIFPAAWQRHQPIFPLALNVAASTRLAMRQRQITTGSDGIAALSYIEDPDFSQRTDQVPFMLPTYEDVDSGDGLVAGNATEWAWSSWSELSASVPADTLLTGIWLEALAGECEIQIGLGGAGSEEAAGTFRFFYATASKHFHKLPVPILVESADRVAYRVRKQGTSTSNIFAALTAVAYTAPTAAARFTLPVDDELFESWKQSLGQP